MRKTGKQGFTLIELLVVIAIISLLASIMLSSLANARIKARDARRMEDLHNIYTSLALYYDTYGCLPVTYGGTTCTNAGSYTDTDGGGWDYSSQGGFLGFLKTSGIAGQIPVDPLNNGTGDVSYTGTGYAYGYYCYPTWYTAAPNTITLQVKLEKTGTVYYYPRQNEPGYICQ